MSHRSEVSTALGIAIAILVVGCHQGRPPDESPPGAAATPSVVLEVQNHNWSDIDVYVLHDGRTDRLATVTAAKDASVPIPARLLGETGVFQLVVYRIGGQDSYVSGPLSIRTGNTVQLTVESDLRRSSVGVW